MHNDGTSSRMEMVEFLSSRERAAYEAWRATPSDDVLQLHLRSVAWHDALRKLNAELAHRDLLLGAA